MRQSGGRPLMLPTCPKNGDRVHTLAGVFGRKEHRRDVEAERLCRQSAPRAVGTCGGGSGSGSHRIVLHFLNGPCFPLEANPLCAESSDTSDRGKRWSSSLGGLRRLEYRGYDSAGVATISTSGSLLIVKTAGRIDRLANAAR